MHRAHRYYQSALTWLQDAEHILQKANPASAKYDAAVAALKNANESLSIASERLNQGHRRGAGLQ